ncbi:RdRP-domain-containing protein [Auricularia subglabra TFB-10046 SS5]|nr:RdRP-domain-containing protein [Auricularia subglabra TFB-10046 SS5]
MEIKFGNVAYSATEYDVVDEFAKTLHSPEFSRFSPSAALLNFQVNLFMRQRVHRASGDLMPGHAGAGILTIPDMAIGRHFLQRYGAPAASRSIYVGGRRVSFRSSEDQPPRGLVDDLLNRPWQNPRRLAEQHRRDARLAQAKISVAAVQFGWRCRDRVYSIEWESTDWNELRFEYSLRQINLGLYDLPCLPPAHLLRPTIALKYSHIDSVTVPEHSSGEHSLLFDLSVAPSFEIDPPPGPGYHKERRTRAPFPGKLKRSGCFIAHWLRIVVGSHTDVASFLGAAEIAGLRAPEKLDYQCERRGLFADATLDELDAWIPTLQLGLAIQVSRILHERLLDAREVLELKDEIKSLDHTWSHGEHLLSDLMTPTDRGAPGILPLDMHIGRLSRSMSSILHVSVSPANVSIIGPIPDDLNRVLYQYRAYHENFIRVAFVDNDGQPFRYDPDVNTQALVDAHVLPILRDGLTLGGRLFKFLAYSQSGLKQHWEQVWLVHTFTDALGHTHSASTIRASLGTFTKDERCPARVGARMSLAFSATVPSGSLSVARLRNLPDIGGDGHTCMTDGAGLISRAAMDRAWIHFCAARGRRGRTAELPPAPSVIQVRVKGAKGVLLVDPTLQGLRIVVRPSMVKFSAGEQYDNIEICNAFTAPSRAFLNRPLIMVLEARGVPKETFLWLQQQVVAETQLAVQSLLPAAALLESNGLGESLNLPTLLRRIASRFANFPEVEQHLVAEDAFMTRCLDFAVNHVLRGLKFRGRIPVPDSWTLVGVPDHHGILEEGEVLVGIMDGDPLRLRYLKGGVTVTRSPVCHPGDVMVMRAIGPPRAGSAFELLRPKNCIVFSTKGSRSPVSCLGGGDYDGDEYVVMKPAYMRPPEPAAPAMYKNSPRQDIGRRYRKEDLLKVVPDFINNDQLPRIAATWLRIADISPQGVYDPRCLKLSALHSIAVDFPKTGIPVKHADIPQAPNMFPDWSMSELGAADHNKSFMDRIYPSDRALGHLYRAISLPAVGEARTEGRAQREAAKARRKLTHSAAEEGLASGAELLAHPMLPAVDQLVSTIAPQASEECARDELSDLVQLLNQYCVDLRLVCQQNTLSRSRRAQLTEEELVTGTIVARVSSLHYRGRENHMARMNEQMGLLKTRICAELAGEMSTQTWQRVRRASTAWKLSVVDDQFGSSSFGLIALGALFETVKELEDGAARAAAKAAKATSASAASAGATE